MKLENKTHQPTTRREYVNLFLTGLGMGAADSVPGVSGGTVAFVRGIYGDLLNAIKSFNLDALRLLLKLDFKGLLEQIPLRFLLTLGSGIAIALLTLARVVSWLLENQREYLFAFFFGLVLASGLAVAAKIHTWSPRNLVLLVVGAVAAFVIVGLVPTEQSHDPLTIFLSGFFAIMAMILPGISGSSILLILGQYEYIINSIRDFNLPPLLFLGMGCALGIGVFSRLLSWLLGRFPQATLAVLIGFVIGSLRAVWPWQVESTVTIEGVAETVYNQVLPNVATPDFWMAVALMIVGFLLVSFVDHLQSHENPFMRLFWRPKAIVEPSGQAAQ
jgi:putative membrane protein